MPAQSPVIAVVDDDVSVCTGVQRLLRSAGLGAATFTSGPAFLAALADTLPACVVLDIRMPGMTGFEVQARLRALGCGAPIILITADDRERMHDEALAASAFAFLQKPFDGDLLVRTVTAALSSARPTS